MSRGQGRVYRPKVDGCETAVWWLDYSVRGKRHRESSGTTNKADAQRLLRERIGSREAGKLVGRPDRVTLAEYAKGEDGKDKLVGGLRALVERQYALDGRKSVARVKDAFGHLENFFGAEARVAEITKPRLDAYAEHRLAAGRARATVNNELAQLRRGFRLAIEAGLLAVMPVFKLPKPDNAREGFFEDDDFAAMMVELPGDARRDLVQFLRHTGWRRDEGRLLQWAMVDREGETIRLERKRAKSKKARVFPFNLAPPLKELLAKRWAVRDGLYVFHIDGQPIGTQGLRYAWAHACLRAGLAVKNPMTKKIECQRLVHDLRRSAARDFRRYGLSESDIMDLCGWDTLEMFRRYCIIDERALAQAVGKRYGKVPAKSEPSTESSPSLS